MGQDVFISELMYDPRTNDDQLEYIELYNAGATVSIAGWTIPAVGWTFPAGAQIQGGQYLVIAQDPATLQRIYNLPTTPMGPYSKDLSNKGEKVELIDVANANTVVHSVEYDINPPWSPLAADFGSSLELICFVKPTETWHWVAGPLPGDVDPNVEYAGSPGAGPKWRACLTKTYDPPHKVKFSEIMYSPLSKKAYEELHEFVEIYNPETTEVDVSRWRIVANSGMIFTFPANSKIGPNTLVTIAKNPTELRAVYGTIPGTVYGPYSGELGNGKTGLALVDANGFVIDFVEYDDSGNWPYATDALGATQADLYTGNPFKDNYASYRFKGQSLSRRSWSWPSTSTYNWREANPSPGADNIDPSNLPNLIVTQKPNKPTNTEAVTVTAELKPLPLSPGVAVSATLTWFVDNVITGVAPTVNTVTMTYTTDALGTFTGVIPAQPYNTIIRYSVSVALQGGVTRRIPRVTDPFQHKAYFVEPLPPGNTASPIYHIFIERFAWGRLWTNIRNGGQPNYSRVTDSPPCTERLSWDEKEKAVLIYEGEVYDILLRYQGSRWNRPNGVSIEGSYAGYNSVGPLGPDKTLKGFSLNIDIPDWANIHGHHHLNFGKMWQGCTMYQTALLNDLSEMLGLPSGDGYVPHRFARVHMNGHYYRYMLVQGTDFAQSQADRVTNNCLDHPSQLKPHLFKAKGANINEAGWGRADFRPLSFQCLASQWPADVRYAKTYDRKTHGAWAGGDYLRQTIEENDGLTSSNARDWLSQKLDLNFMLSFHALINWAGTWDNTFQNQWYLYREEDKKWFQAVWDADRLFGEARGPTTNLYAGDMSYEAHYLRNNIVQYMKPELNSRFRLLQATVLSDAVLTPLLESIIAEFNITEANLSPGGFGQDWNTCTSTIRGYMPLRRSYVNQQISSWNTVERTDPNVELQKVKCPTLPTITRRFHTWNGAPGQPLELNIKSKTHAKLEFAWVAPNSWNSPLTGYKVTYTSVSAKRQTPTIVDLPATATSFSLDNPGGSTTYTVSVSAVSDQGSGTPITFTVVTDHAPVDCVWSQWTEWAMCTVLCGTGSHTRTRTVQVAAAYGGVDCMGPPMEMEACNTQACPIDCVWEEWAAWTACTATCGTADRTRTRTIKVPAQFGGVNCTGVSSQTEACTVPPCPADCTWQTWSEWSTCPSPCGGTQTRTRGSVNAMNGGKACDGTGTETLDCTRCPPPPGPTPPGPTPPGPTPPGPTPPGPTPPGPTPPGPNPTPNPPGPNPPGPPGPNPTPNPEPGPIPPEPTPSTPEDDKDDGPPVGLIVGIVVGVVGATALLAGCIYFYASHGPRFETV